MPFEITYSRFGPPDVLEWSASGEMPEPLPSQVVIRVVAASINSLDAKIRSGSLVGSVTTLLPTVPGRDASGIVVAVGSRVTDVAVGDAVFGFTDTGAYAEYAALSSYALKPDTIDWTVAACLPTVGETAVRLLDELGLTAGETLIVTGGAGNVGAITTQLAVARGIRVIATVGARDDNFIRSMGATPVRYGARFTDRVLRIAPRGLDAAIDTAGAGELLDLIGITGAAQRVVTIADPGASTYGVRFSGAGDEHGATEALAQVAALAAVGAIRVRIAASYPMREAARAHRDLAGGHLRGKLVLHNSSAFSPINE